MYPPHYKVNWNLPSLVKVLKMTGDRKKPIIRLVYRIWMCKQWLTKIHFGWCNYAATLNQENDLTTKLKMNSRKQF